MTQILIQWDFTVGGVRLCDTKQKNMYSKLNSVIDEKQNGKM